MNIYTLLLEPTVTILEVNAFPILRGSKIYQQICVDKFVWFHSFRKTPACLEEKTNSRHIFVDLLEFAHFCRFCIFFPKKSPCLGRMQSKRMGSAHFCCGGGLVIISLDKKKISYFQKSAKNFFYRKKIQLQVSKSGVFWKKKIFRKFLETSVIISL